VHFVRQDGVKPAAYTQECMALTETLTHAHSSKGVDKGGARGAEAPPVFEVHPSYLLILLYIVF